MSLLVVDASVGLKWFIPEVQSAAARRLRASGNELHVPSLFDLEFASILWKKIRRSELSRPEADVILAKLLSLPLTRHPDAGLIASAFDFADRTGQTVYDCIYLALALQLAGRFVTADQRFFNNLRQTTLADLVVWIGDW
jgi:predicted nucleic acid-binding protein